MTTTERAQPSPREETVDVWNGRLQLRVKVAGQGAPLLYLHGSTGLAWDPFLSRLAEQYTVYAPEFPGTSAGEPDAAHVIDDLSDMVLAFEEASRSLGLSQPVVVGHDFGGMLAAELAAHFPALPGKLVLISPLGLWRDDLPVATLSAASQTELPGLLFHDPSGDVAQAALAFPEDPEAAVEAAAGMVWSLGSTGKYLWPIPDRGLRARLHRVAARTLIVWGREDRLAPAAYADEFAGLIRDSAVALIDDSGHLPQVEQFKQALTRIEEFLK
ncbi:MULTISPECIES: alpha/beta fold hydrolase [Actinomycetes]|uniref:Alpha/beta fold hydrolase n=1 Tax=Streptomyces tendae TaxID=1932 RepID=A0A6B3QRU4_STRTE|nr:MULTISPECIES: alpha/beta fold hydrolase [Streptomyces]BET45173.1 alpha/beta hydrolase [Kitasatospora aureofaciens]MBQ0968636.1 alpha/beta fold hydrolase [Streptomyces sp. RK74B]MBQ1008691.1 alpha/beta fold hydrolase [Streptomyces sp. RK23]MZG15440.1 alpha/beta fold hydrolase [Streptomyces sp. SID5914]NEV89910.1 alpha/beta fold hydrolase [Streptomyces tendae]